MDLLHPAAGVLAGDLDVPGVQLDRVGGVGGLGGQLGVIDHALDVAILLAVLAALVLQRTIYGRWVLAVGQNMRAARFAGVRVGWTRLVTYMLCGALGGIDGALLAGYFRGANVDIGNEYLLSSSAVVVIGGSSVAGGKGNLPGIWGAALFLVLLVTMLNTFGVSAGIRLLLTGIIIVAAIAVASDSRASDVA